ncbi:MAG: mitochondrial import subunit Tom22 [Lasallia pustulata]|uniref:Mitochondrial import subunit Tom22 n=1 Tax=Lasallia pustulata TaxID=136370 RepID=A0A5M8PH55_9LECA|nr:MAG: mitochondrial import subunit Tom22 [Lasallia pustulata]
MVQLEEVEDADLIRLPRPGPIDDDDADFTDTDSSLSSTSSSLPLTITTPDESLRDRLLALRDMLPPSTRRRIAASTATFTGYVKSGLLYGGKTLWVVSTSALLLGMPFALAFAEEQQVVEMEKEQRMRELGNEVLTPGAATSAAGRPAL